MTAQTKFRSLKLAPFDIYLRTLAFKVRNAVGSFLSDEEVIENIDVMANFMRGVYQGGVSISLGLKELISINISRNVLVPIRILAEHPQRIYCNFF